ncbi:MAG TPA: protein kinase [Rhabdochlamydiaceae bacterium]|nr:protein kinase [Rhabdochlamydiaceae bacterium]
MTNKILDSQAIDSLIKIPELASHQEHTLDLKGISKLVSTRLEKNGEEYKSLKRRRIEDNIVFNKSSEGDRIAGKGAKKKAKYALNTNSGQLKIAAITEISAESNRERIFYEHAQKARTPDLEKTVMTCDYIEEYTNKKGVPKVAFIQQYMNLGTLDELLKNPLSANQVWEVISSLLTGLKEIDKLGFHHRDIKLANIFIYQDENGNLLVKIGDFDRSCKKNDPTDYKNRVVGTTEYWSYDYRFSHERCNLLEKQDVWSMGIVLFNIVADQLTPWQAFANSYTKKQNFSLEEYNRDVMAQVGHHASRRMDWFPQLLRVHPIGSLIYDMLDPDSAKRPSISEVWDRFEQACKTENCTESFARIYDAYLNPIIVVDISDEEAKADHAKDECGGTVVVPQDEEDISGTVQI